MRVSRVSRSRDSCSDLAARVSAAWRSTCFACSSAARPRPSAAPAAAPNPLASSTLRRGEAAAAEQQRLSSEPAGRSGGAPRASRGTRRARASWRSESCAAGRRAGVLERDQGGVRSPEQGPRLVQQRGADVAGRSREQPRDGLEGRGCSQVGRWRSRSPGCHRHAEGRLYTAPHPRRGGRVAEGTRLLSEYGAESSIAGSNPALSAPPPALGRWLHSCHCARSSAG